MPFANGILFQDILFLLKNTKVIITNAKIQSNLFITNDKIVQKIIIGNEKSCL